MNSFDDIIQHKADGHKAPVPPGAWDNIIKKEKKRRPLFFWWMLAALLCGSMIGGYYVYNGGKAAEKKQVGKVERVDGLNQVDVVDKVNNGGKIEVDKVDKVGSVSKDIVVTEEEKLNTIVDEVNEVNNVKKVDIDNAGNNVNKVDKVNTGNKTLANKKERSKAFGTGKTINETVLNSKTRKKTSINENNTGIDVNDKAEENNNESWATKNKTVKKDKGRSSVKIITPEMGESATTVEEKKNRIAENKNEVGINDECNNIPGKESLAAVDQSPLKKEIDADSIKSKISTTTPGENKRSIPVARKQKTKNPLFIDIAITPVFPIEQYDRSTTFNRTLFLNNSQTIFSGKLVSTGIDPSLAFSIALRKKISKRFYLGLGIQYVELKENIRIAGTETKTNYNIIDVLDNSGGTPQLIRDTFVTVTQGTRNINAVNSYHFWDIPVFLQYGIIQKRSWSLNAVAGVQANIAARYKNELNHDSMVPLISSSPS